MLRGLAAHDTRGDPHHFGVQHLGHERQRDEHSDMKIARIFGTKASVISWICVSAWNSEMATPTASPTSITRARDNDQCVDCVTGNVENFGTGHDLAIT